METGYIVLRMIVFQARTKREVVERNSVEKPSFLAVRLDSRPESWEKYRVPQFTAQERKTDDTQAASGKLSGHNEGSTNTTPTRKPIWKATIDIQYEGGRQ
jgi:hypothetical protein